MTFRFVERLRTASRGVWCDSWNRTTLPARLFLLENLLVRHAIRFTSPTFTSLTLTSLALTSLTFGRGLGFNATVIITSAFTVPSFNVLRRLRRFVWIFICHVAKYASSTTIWQQ